MGESQAPLVQVAWPDGVYPAAHSKVTLAPLAMLAPTAALMLLVVKAVAQGASKGTQRIQGTQGRVS